jgi:hypothetical protein
MAFRLRELTGSLLTLLLLTMLMDLDLVRGSLWLRRFSFDPPEQSLVIQIDSIQSILFDQV